MKNLLNIIFGIAVYSIVNLLFMGYGHTETHVPLNKSITLRFLELVTTSDLIDKAKFKNYEFNWNNNSQPDLVGPAIIKDYYPPYSEKEEVNKSNTP